MGGQCTLPLMGTNFFRKGQFGVFPIRLHCRGRAVECCWMVYVLHDDFVQKDYVSPAKCTEFPDRPSSSHTLACGGNRELKYCLNLFNTNGEERYSCIAF